MYVYKVMAWMMISLSPFLHKTLHSAIFDIKTFKSQFKELKKKKLH